MFVEDVVMIESRICSALDGPLEANRLLSRSLQSIGPR